MALLLLLQESSDDEEEKPAAAGAKRKAAAANGKEVRPAGAGCAQLCTAGRRAARAAALESRGASGRQAAQRHCIGCAKQRV